jgi:DNA invertase Pin-like site-specific DNA recombinase
MGNVKRVIAYVRVSTERQAAEGVSLSAQRAKITAWAQVNGYQDILVFEDAGYSGKSMGRREGLLAALAAVKASDALVVYSLSRLARSTKDAIAISEVLSKRGADLVSLSERIDTTSAAGKMVFRLMAVMGEFESDLIAERVSGALQHKKARGEKAGYVPFGFHVARDGRRLEADPREQAILARIDAMRAQRASLASIARHLNEAGMQTRSGAPWAKQYVHNLITSKPARASYREVSV